MIRFARSLLERHARAGFFTVLGIQLLLLLQACTSLGLEQPKNFRDDYAYALGQTTALANASATALEARQISIKDAEYVLRLTDQSKAYIDTAKQVYEAGETLKGKSQLELATNVLTQLQSYLNSRAPLTSRAPK